MLISAPGNLSNGCNLLSLSNLKQQSSQRLHKKKQWRTVDRRPLLPVFCSSLQKELPQLVEEDAGVICEHCNGRGWVLCDFCRGKKNNVTSETNRIYRRCPSCKAVGYVLCSKCKVYKCVTFPDYGDGEL